MVVCLSTATACRIQPVRDSDVVANAAVVSVICRTGRHGTVGTGFAIAPTRIVTARHVIEGHSDLYVRLADGRQVAAKFVVAESEEHDVAVLEIEETPDLPVLGWAAEVPQEGDVHRCVSSVGGRAQTVTTVVCTGPEEVRKRFGLVSRWRGDLGVGASGAPILDGNGRVLSMVVGADTDLAAWNAVPARVLVLEDGARWSQTAWAEKTRTEPASAARAVYDRALSVYVEKRHQEALDELERGFAALAAVPDYAEESLVLIAV
jgi:hypothetical protein